MVLTNWMQTYCTMMRVMILCGAVILAFHGTAIAGPKLVPVEGATYNVGISFADNLKTFIGKRVTLNLKSGALLIGTVKDVGTHLVHLEKLDRKEYFDGLVRLDEISAMDSRFREHQR